MDAIQCQKRHASLVSLGRRKQAGGHIFPHKPVRRARDGPADCLRSGSRSTSAGGRLAAVAGMGEAPLRTEQAN